eukprot:TRINITY_DN14333_c0_g1_i1.p1 TRINITY_DN14333_c0_g1~~TRINITY_DN14333_c0_g1_i1.p1  ORF type:complete len:360 (+),score=88.55 TRINITY_DN14333_c0_g1_i1:237-1316(+)
MGCCTSKEKSPKGQISKIESGEREADFSGKVLRRQELDGISRAVLGSSNLTTLLLSWAGLKDKGVSILEGALCGSPSLETLVLAGNGITNKGAVVMSRVLEHTTSLQMCSLAENKIANSGLSALATAVEKNDSLTDLRLGGNRMVFDDTEEAMEVLDPLFRRRKRLTFFDLRGNPIDGTVLTDILERMARPQELQLDAASITNSELFTTHNREARDTSTPHLYSPPCGQGSNPLAASKTDDYEDVTSPTGGQPTSPGKEPNLQKAVSKEQVVVVMDEDEGPLTKLEEKKNEEGGDREEELPQRREDEEEQEPKQQGHPETILEKQEQQEAQREAPETPLDDGNIQPAFEDGVVHEKDDS